MRDFLSTYCLEMMGIQIWSEADTALKLDFELYDLYNVMHKKVGNLCLQKLPMKAAQEKPVFRLLDAMLAAVKLKRAPIQNSLDEEDGFVLLMGEPLVQQALASQLPLDELRAANPHAYRHLKLRVTYHPLDLLIEPSNKMKAWEDLKQL